VLLDQARDGVQTRRPCPYVIRRIGRLRRNDGCVPKSYWKCLKRGRQVSADPWDLADACAGVPHPMKLDECGRATPNRGIHHE
jgi:hypothetical protein